MHRTDFISRTTSFVQGGGLLILAADCGACAKRLRWNMDLDTLL